MKKWISWTSHPSRASRNATLFSCGVALLAQAGPWAVDHAEASPRKPPFRVVIDPGHGGADHGTVYRDSRIRIAEKDITLLLALRTADQLRAKGIEVVLTRTSDQEVSLPARTALANRMKADVFLSIHMNSSPDQRADAEGFETYILNTASDASSRRLAHLENSVIDSSAPGAPGQTDVALILKDLRLDGNLAHSKLLACSIQSQLQQSSQSSNPLLASAAYNRVGGGPRGIRNRGVKQALFYVLLGADMPSVLVEAGFLTHPRDRAMVLSYEGQTVLSQAMTRAIEHYRKARQQPSLAASTGRCKVN